MRMQYACCAGIAGGVARCRKLVRPDDPYGCEDHPGGLPAAPRPDTILVKVNLNEKWYEGWAKVRVLVYERSLKRSWELAQQREQQASALGRSALAPDRDKTLDVPETRHSGCPVFGKTGLQAVEIGGLADEFKAGGFILTKTYRLDRQHKPPARLVLEFRRPRENEVLEISADAKDFPWWYFNVFVKTCFGQVDVWANPRDERGLVVHTVNCGKRDDGGTARYRLRFAGGDWAAEEL